MWGRRSAVMDRRRLWLRLIYVEVVLLAALTVFVWFESWLVGVNLEAEGALTGTLEMVLAGERVILVSVLVGTAVVGAAGLAYAWSAERQRWPFVVLGLVFLVYALLIAGARPSWEVRQRALSVPRTDLEQLLR